MVSGKKEGGWKKLFNKYVDTSKDLNIISTQKIRECVGEVRLATKMDCREQLPKVFKDNGYFLLPLKNGGDFAIVKGDGFHDLEPNYKTKKFISKLKTDLVTLSERSGEMKYLDYAYYTGLLEDFLKIKGLYLTIRGREYTKPFSFKFGKIQIKVTSVQIEVDAGYESVEDSSIVIIEAKVGKKLGNFNIRQLYYPLRSYMEKIKEKKYKTVFFTYNPKDDSYNFWDYRFKTKNQFLSIKLDKKASYKIKKAGKTLSAKDILKSKIGSSYVTNEMGIPQADDFEKIVEFPFKVKKGINNSKKIAKEFKFTKRQSSYYRQATEFVGLVKSEKNKYKLTEVGLKYVNSTADKRNSLLCSLLFKMPILDKVLRQILKNRKNKISLLEITTIINKNTKYNLNTSKRRAKTIISWFGWIEKTLGVVKVSKNIIRLANTK